MEETRPPRDPGADHPRIPPGYDYEYDEAHDVPAGPLHETPAPHRVDPPRGYISARAGTMATTRPTISAPDNQPRPEQRTCPTVPPGARSPAASALAETASDLR